MAREYNFSKNKKMKSGKSRGVGPSEDVVEEIMNKAPKKKKSLFMKKGNK